MVNKDKVQEVSWCEGEGECGVEGEGEGEGDGEEEGGGVGVGEEEDEGEEEGADEYVACAWGRQVEPGGEPR